MCGMKQNALHCALIFTVYIWLTTNFPGISLSSKSNHMEALEHYAPIQLIGMFIYFKYSYRLELH